MNCAQGAEKYLEERSGLIDFGPDDRGRWWRRRSITLRG
jgi:hypothetical protein